jgi:transcriptional regulator with XRE-family HTH domain
MVANERLRDAMMRAGHDTTTLAGELEVDPKTVERWITKNRSPHAKTRARAASLLGETQSFLWPDAFDDRQRAEISESELVRIYQRRLQIDPDTWSRLIDHTNERLDVLVIAGLFLPEQQYQLAQRLCDKGKAGVRVRILLADPGGEQVLRRGAEEGIGDTIEAKVRNVLAFFESHANHDCFQIRLHDTTLYNSIYRFDEDLLVNSHILGLPAAQAPVYWYRRLPGGGLFEVYADCFDRIWSGAKPAWDREEAVS